MPARERPDTSAIIQQAIQGSTRSVSESSDDASGSGQQDAAVEQQKSILESKIQQSKQQAAVFRTAFKKDSKQAKKIEAQAQAKKRAGLEKQADGSETSAWGQGMLAAGAAIAAAGAYLGPYGWIAVLVGLIMVATGVGLVVEGAKKTSEGNIETALAMEGVEDAINKGNLAEVKAQQATAKLGETSMYMAMLAQLEVVKEQTPETDNMSEDELAQWEAQEMARIQEGFTIAAQSIMDNGIFTLKGQNGEDLYFAQEGNDFYLVEPEKDSSGNLKTGEQGELTGNYEVLGAVDRNSEDYAALSMYAAFERVIRNDKVPGVGDHPPLTRVVRAGDGTYTTVPVNLDNAEDRAWIAAITRSAAQNGDNGLRYIQDDETGQWGYRMQDMHTEEWLSPFVASSNLNDTTFDQLGITGFDMPSFSIRNLGTGEASFNPSAYGLVGANAEALASSFIGGSLSNDTATTGGDSGSDPDNDDDDTRLATG